MKLTYIVSLILATFIGTSSPAYSTTAVEQDFLFVGWENPPFYYLEPGQGIHGAYHEVMAEVCRIHNLKCRFKIQSFRKALDMVKEGNAQSGGPFAYTFARAEVIHYTDRLFSSAYGFFILSKNAKKVTAYQDLRGATVGVLAQSVSELSLQTINEFLDDSIKVVQEPSTASVLKRLEIGAFLVAYVHRDSANIWIRKNRGNIEEIPALGENLEYRLSFSKKAVSPSLQKNIDATLMQLRANGFLEKVAAKYKVALSTNSAQEEPATAK